MLVEGDLGRSIHQPPASPHQAECQPPLPHTTPPQQVLETNAVPPDTVASASTMQPTTRREG